MQSYKEYIYNLNNSRKIILAGLSQTRLPYSISFPKVSELTIYRMDRYSFYYSVNPSNFPNLRVINYLIPDDIDFEMFMEMGCNLVWRTLEKNTHPLLEDLPKKQNLKLSNGQYFKILKDHRNYHEHYLQTYIAVMR